MAFIKILDIASLEDTNEEKASVDVASHRAAIMASPNLQNIILGASDNKRIIECRYDEKNNAMYPYFKEG